ncbi:hypothetical protein [Roseateles albus]|uniref:Type II secretion system protein GspC N-terminal domain-containing protein n=1 Tax=Roseateles albus TaxID=2987525 RepID=A0ABT5KAQ5_9BURK|nr:hypothetical protein [Roseateles albus]MDC8771003.1 hypothetical protein [Roseateles albus]
MRAQLRSRLLMGALSLSLAATAWVASREEEEGAASNTAAQGLPRVGLAKPAPPKSQAWPAGWPAALAAPTSKDGPAWPEAAAIARQSWGLAAVAEADIASAPAPSKAKAGPGDSAAEAAPPAAPLMDYQLLGRMDEAGRPRIVLSNAQRTLVLGVGELIDQQWRIDAIGPTGAQLTWLAGGQKQNLAFSSP